MLTALVMTLGAFGLTPIHLVLEVDLFGSRIFAEWFNKQGFRDTTVSPTRLASCLHDKFKQGWSTEQCNNLRTAVSMTAPPWQGVPLGECEIVCQITKSIGNKKPLAPKYGDSYGMLF